MQKFPLLWHYYDGDIRESHSPVNSNEIQGRQWDFLAEGLLFEENQYDLENELIFLCIKII